MFEAKQLGARLNISGRLECKDKDGNVLKVIDMKGSIPLAELGITPEEAQQLIDQQG